MQGGSSQSLYSVASSSLSSSSDGFNMGVISYALFLLSCFGVSGLISNPLFSRCSWPNGGILLSSPMLSSSLAGYRRLPGDFLPIDGTRVSERRGVLRLVRDNRNEGVLRKGEVLDLDSSYDDGRGVDSCDGSGTEGLLISLMA